MPIIHAIISDLDDTLLTEDHRMTERTVQALQRVMRQGVKVVLASGRSAASIRPFVRKVQTPSPYIAYNGAQILDAATDQILTGNEISVEMARQVLRWFEAQDVYVQYYEGDDWFYETPCAFSEDYGKATGIVGKQAAGTLSQCVERPTAKLLAVATPEHVQALIPAARTEFGNALSITTSKPYFIEVTSPEATKGNAVKKLAAMLGLSPETTICAGDSLNDMSMLEWSCLPVSVKNAREEVQRIAWRVAGDGHRDGIAALLDELIPPQA